MSKCTIPPISKERWKELLGYYFDCIGSHCGATIYVADVQESLWTQIICPKCGRKYILSFNEEYPNKEGTMRGYYLEPAEKY